MGSEMRLVGQVSVYCDWVREKAWSATSMLLGHEETNRQLHHIEVIKPKPLISRQRIVRCAVIDLY